MMRPARTASGDASSSTVRGKLADINEARNPPNHHHSSGIGAALALEYAGPNTHLVLIARDLTRLNWVATEAQAKGATTSVHSIDLMEPANMAKLHQLLNQIDTDAEGIDVAISCAGVTAHRSDVLGPNLAHIPPLDQDQDQDQNHHPIQPTPPDDPAAMEAGATPLNPSPEDSSHWGATTASRMLQVNVAATQSFILHTWSLMKARQQQHPPTSTTTNKPTSNQPTIIILSSSTAFFTPSTFALYAASKSYLYTLARSLQLASVPHGINVVPVTPGFMQTGMTHTMRACGATMPKAVLGDPRGLAGKIKRRVESGEVGGVVFYPAWQGWALWALRGLGVVGEVVGMWVAAGLGVAGWTWS